MTVFSRYEFNDAQRMFFEMKLLKKYPFVRRERIGYSVLHRELVLYSIGEGGTLIAAVFHAMERVGGAILCRYLFEKAREAKCRDRVNLCAIPLMNPDGVEIALRGADSAGRFSSSVRRVSRGNTALWQSNARGVDLNHNFNAGFVALRESEIRHGYITKGATRFSGGAPETEPETKAICELCRERFFSSVIALHSQGREIYADFGEVSDESRKIAQRMAAVSGYTVSAPSGTAVGGGFKDWFYQTFHRPSFTIEIGLGKNPLDKSVADTEYARVKRMLDVVVNNDK